MAKHIRRFGEFEFTSVDAARRFFGKIRNDTPLGETIENPAHVLAISELLEGHKEYEAKVGCGVKRFYVWWAPDHPNATCFWIEREDGEPTDFGFPACINSIGGLNRQSFRALIRPEIRKYRDSRLAGCVDFFVSDYSGKKFPISEVHVDHKIKFEEIILEFADQQNIPIETELLTVSCDATSEPTWKDPALAQKFLEFHSQFPLRIVSRRENLSELNRKPKCGQNEEQVAV